MANVLPASKEQMIAWFSERVAKWAADPAAIGLTAAQVADLAGRVSSAETALNNAFAARTASKDATVVLNNQAGDLRSVGSDLIKVIKAYAESTDDPGVYAAASVPPPAPPAPAGPPPQPTDLSANLLPGGSLRLEWKGSSSQGAYFSIFRQTGGETGFTLLDSTNDKFYEDATIPAGVSSVIYYIQARRDEFRVDSAHFQVSFGASGTTQLTLAA